VDSARDRAEAPDTFRLVIPFDAPDTFPLADPCPAAIWLLGGAAGCNKQAGHDGPHQVIIEWSVS
jgi:hypothetical protein